MLRYSQKPPELHCTPKNHQKYSHCTTLARHPPANTCHHQPTLALHLPANACIIYSNSRRSPSSSRRLQSIHQPTLATSLPPANVSHPPANACTPSASQCLHLIAASRRLPPADACHQLTLALHLPANAPIISANPQRSPSASRRLHSIRQPALASSLPPADARHPPADACTPFAS